MTDGDTQALTGGDSEPQGSPEQERLVGLGVRGQDLGSGKTRPYFGLPLIEISPLLQFGMEP